MVNPKKIFLKSLLLLVLFVYLSSPSLMNAESSVLTDEQNKWLQENFSSISFAPESDFPPMIWSRYGVLFGVSSDYFDLIQQTIDTRFHVREPRKLTEILESIITNNERSIISSRTETPERSKYLLFTRPYFSSPSIFISKNVKTSTGKEIEQQGYSVSVGNQFGVHEYLKNRYPEMKLVPFDNDYQVVKAVIDNQADVGAINITSLVYLINENNFLDLRKVGDIGFSTDFSFAVPKNLPELQHILDDAIEVIPQNSKELILKRWGIDPGNIQNLADEQIVFISDKNIDNQFTTTMVIFIALFIILTEFILHRFFLKNK